MRGFKALAEALARAAADKKGEDVLALALGRKNPVADYLIIVSALSRPHLQTLEDALEDAAAELGFPVVRRAKPKSDSWRVVDFGKVLAHVMTPEARDFYALEKLHHDAARLDWRKSRAETKRAKASA